MGAEDFSWIREGAFGGMSRPGIMQSLADDLTELREEHGVGAVLSLTEAPLDRTTVEALGMAYAHLPVPDFSAPAEDQVRAAVAFFEEARRAGKPLAIHCAAGMGRTGTMLAVLLVAEGLDSDAAIAEVRRRRPGSIEVSEQEDAVRAYAHTQHRE